MARYNKEVRVVYFGDKDLAARYLAEGRKYLGMLDDSRSVPTQTRILTNSDGVTFRVGFYYDQPFIEITAGKSFSDRYELITHRGYVVAPRTSSYTAYSSNPAVIINPFAGIETLWGSTFFDDPGDLTGSTHPTSVYSDPFATYGEYFPNLSGNTLSRSNRFAYTQLMSWNNSDEKLWLYWYGCEHGRSNHIWWSEVFHNGVFLFDLDDFMTSIMMLGLSAKRTTTGLLLTMTVINKISNSLSELILCTIALSPTEVEKERLDKIKVDGSYGYAAEYVADMDTFTVLSLTAINGSIQYYSSHPHNQSGNESRGFIGVLSGTTINLTEWVIDYRDTDAIIVTGYPAQSVTDTLDVTTTYGNTILQGIINKHCTFMGFGVPPHETYGIGTYSFDLDTVPYKIERYNTGDGAVYTAATIFPAQYDSDSRRHINVAKIKCFVDYMDDTPVYAYLHISDTSDIKSQTCTWSNSESPPTGTLYLEVFDSYPLTSAWFWVAHSSVTQESSCNWSRSQTTRTYGISAPNYLNGLENGDWLNEAPVTTRTEDFSAAAGSTIVTGYGPSPYNRFLADGTTFSYTPTVKDTVMNTESLSVSHLNLRTKSAFYLRDRTVTTINNVQSNTYTYNDYYPYTDPSSVIVIDRIEVIPAGGNVETTTSETKKKTIFKHAGLTVFDSGYITTSTSNNVLNYGVGSFWDIGAVFFRFNTNTNAYVGANTYYNSPTYPSVTYGVVDYTPDADVDTTENFAPSLGPPWRGSYDTRSGQPGGTVGISTTKGSYIANVNYASGLSNAYSALVITNDVGYTLDYMTGAHAAQWFSPPYLLSAIAIKQIKL